MFITADQILIHAIGDYIFQSNWMATNKTKYWLAAFLHALTYTANFIWLTTDISVLLVIGITHYFIDRYRLARFIIWFKNVPWDKWEDCSATGYHKDVPIWLSTWLLIITDNIMHVIINGLALYPYSLLIE